MHRIAALLVALALVAAGCGDDDTAGDGATTTTAATTTVGGDDGATTTTEAPTTTATETTTTTGGGAPPPEVRSGTLWASDASGEAVLQIDPDTGDLLSETPIGGNAESIAFGSGSVWVVSNLNGEVARIDPVSGDLLATIPCGANTAGIAVSGGLVYAANYGEGPDFASTVCVIDPATDAVVDTLEVPSGATGMTEVYGVVFGTTWRDGEVYRIDPDGGVTSAPVGEGLAEIALVGTELWVSSPPAGTVYRVDPASLEVIGSLEVPGANFVAYANGRGWITGEEELVAVEAGTGDQASVPIRVMGLDGDMERLFAGSFDGRVYALRPPLPGTEPEVLFERPGASFFDVAIGDGT